VTLFALEAAVYDKLTIKPNLAENTVELSLSGICDSFAVKPLGIYLDRVAAEVLRLGLERVSIDVTKLTLLNSSSLKQFVTFLRPIKLGEHRHTVEFVVDDANPWQRRCLAALVRMCPAAVTLRDVHGASNGHNPSIQMPPVSIPAQRD